MIAQGKKAHRGSRVKHESLDHLYHKAKEETEKTRVRAELYMLPERSRGKALPLSEQSPLRGDARD